METACVYEQTTVIHELTQGIEMAKQLRLDLNSAEARQFLIHQILSSYDKALFVLKSSGQPRATPLPAESSLPKSSISTDCPHSGEFQFDRNVISKKRKLSTSWDNELAGKKTRCSYEKVPKCLDTKQVIKCNNNVVQSAPPPPPSPEKYKIKPTNHHHHQQQLSSSIPGEVLSNLRANLSVNTWDLGAILPPSFSFPSTPFGFSDDDFEPITFSNYFDEELLLQGYSPPFISPAASESNYLTVTDWGSSSSSLDYPTDSVDLYPNFEFSNSFL